MPITVLSGPTILAGQSISDAIDITSSQGKSISGVIIPDEWTPALLSFQLSQDGTTYKDLYSVNGFELSLNITPGTRLVFDTTWSLAAGYVRFRSGSRHYPIIQTEDRVFGTVILT